MEFDPDLDLTWEQREPDQERDRAQGQDTFATDDHDHGGECGSPSFGSSSSLSYNTNRGPVSNGDDDDEQ